MRHSRNPIELTYRKYKLLTDSQRVKLGKLNYLIKQGKFTYYPSGSVSHFLDSISWGQIRSLFGSSWNKPKRESLGKNTVVNRQSLPNNPVPSRSGRPTLNKNRSDSLRGCELSDLGNGLNALGPNCTVSGAEWHNQDSPLNRHAEHANDKMPVSDEIGKDQVQSASDPHSC